MSKQTLKNWSINRNGMLVAWAGFPLTPAGANAARMWFTKWCIDNPDGDPQLVPSHGTRYPTWLREDTAISREGVVEYLAEYRGSFSFCDLGDFFRSLTVCEIGAAQYHVMSDLIRDGVLIPCQPDGWMEGWMLDPSLRPVKV